MVAQRKVLLVDDSELALVTVTGVLEDAGHEVRASDDVQRLDAVLGDWRPDIILTDVNMPGISDGFLSKANGLTRLPDELARLLDSAMF